MKYTRLLLYTLNYVPRQRHCCRIMLLLSCLAVICYFCLISKSDKIVYNDSTRQYLDNATEDYRYASFYWKPDKLPENLKFILAWDPLTPQQVDDTTFEEGRKTFIKFNCSVIDCYVTSDKHFFGNDLSRFDSILFYSQNLNASDLPATRYYHQKYIFFSTESSALYPVCEEEFDEFFNWTFTYKLISDFPLPYFLISNAEGEVIGPKVNMHWDEVGSSNVTEEDLYNLWKSRSKAAAWFVTHCHTRSNREYIVKQLQEALKQYGWTIDIFSQSGCGTLECPYAIHDQCLLLLMKNYFFYMSLENSFAEDYVTEKVLTALSYHVIPIVAGGANYSRFLPPSSYLNLVDYTPEELARTMDRYIKSGREYVQFFKWRSRYQYYSIYRSVAENTCAMCAALHDRTKVETVTMYNNFRTWWSPTYERDCMIVEELKDYR